MQAALLSAGIFVSGVLALAGLRRWLRTRRVIALLKRSDTQDAIGNNRLTPRGRAELRSLVGLAADQDLGKTRTWQTREPRRLPQVISAGLITGIVAVVGTGVVGWQNGLWGLGQSGTHAASTVSASASPTPENADTNPITPTIPTSAPATSAPQDSVPPSSAGDTGPAASPSDPNAYPNANGSSPNGAPPSPEPAPEPASSAPPAPGPCGGVACGDGWENALRGAWVAVISTSAGPLSVPVTIDDTSITFPESCATGPAGSQYVASSYGGWDFAGFSANWSCPVTDQTPNAVAYGLLFSALRDSTGWELRGGQLWVERDGGVAVTFSRPT